MLINPQHINLKDLEPREHDPLMFFRKRMFSSRGHLASVGLEWHVQLKWHVICVFQVHDGACRSVLLGEFDVI